jgi:hypothetical protein
MRLAIPCISVVVLAAALALPFVLEHWSSDAKLSATEAAAALRARLGTIRGFRCTSEESDGTIDLRDVDYTCEPDRSTGDGNWVATNDTEITGIQSMG